MSDITIRRSGIPGPGSDVLQPLVDEAAASAEIASAAATQFEGLLVPGKNLFNPADPDYTPNKFVDAATGLLVTPSPTPSAYSATGFIAVIPGTTYTRSARHQLAYYNASKIYVSGDASGYSLSPTQFTVPSGCYYVRMGIPSAGLSTFQVEEGSTATPYEPYKLVVSLSAMPPLSGDEFDDGSIPPEKIQPGITLEQVAFSKPSKNLFNPADPDVLLGYYVIYSSGVPAANAGYNATGFIPVEAGEQYTVSFSHQRAFYNSSRVYISGTNSGNPATFTVPAGAVYARFSVNLASWPTFQVEEGSTATPYEPYGSVIDPGVLPPYLANVDQALTPDGAPIINPYRPEFLRQCRYRLTKLCLPVPEAVLMHFALGGDSYTHNAARWSGPFADYMTARFGDGGMGWTGFGFLNSGNTAPWTVSPNNQPSYLNGNVRPSKYPCRLFGMVAGTYYTGKGPDLSMATFSASGDAAEIDFPAGHPNNFARLLYVATPGAQVRYTVNGGSSWATLDLSIGTAGVSTSVTVNLPASAGTFRMEWVSGTCLVAGLFARAASGIVISKLGSTGSNVAQWASVDATSWQSSMGILQPQAFIYMDGTNSQGASMAPITWGSNLSTLISRARTAVPGVDILIATPPENQRTTNTVPMTSYAIEGRKRALSLRFSFNDMQDVFGDPANPTEYGSSGAIPLFSPDLIHPDPLTGGRSLLSQFINCVVPPGFS